MSNFLLKDYIDKNQQRIHQTMNDHFAGNVTCKSLVDSVTYSLNAGGKRLRPILAIAACEAAGGTLERVLPFAAALEFIHTYTLVHDDLPAMDDDDLRRGKPTNHKVFGEATAILAGDALLTEAYTMMSKVYEGMDASVQLKIMQRVSQAIGVDGMIAGQLFDMENEAKEFALEDLKRIHTHKTGKLLTVAVEVGALAAGVTATELKRFTDYGYHLGYGFQIVDDVLDIVGGEAIGKSVASDQRRGKATFVALLGVEESKRRAEEEISLALKAIEPLGEKATPLKVLATYVLDRTN